MTSVLEQSGLAEYKFWDALTSLPHVQVIYLYGSRARGDWHERSDIDLAIKYDDPDPFWRNAVHGIMEHSDAFLTYDIVDIDRLPEGLAKAIEKEAVLVYERHCPK